MRRLSRLDTGIACALFLLPFLWFAPQVFGGKTLLPADNLFAFEPWQSYASQFGVEVPHNPLISDLILENYAWKSLILENLRKGEVAGLLWNPRLFAGVPFLAAGQHSALYPFSIIFYILPLWLAYGVFTCLQLGWAGLGMFLFGRVLGLRPASATLASIAYAFSGFFIASVNFSMVIAAAAWLPWLLAVIETVARKQEQKGDVPYSPVPYVAAGALLLGCQALAGHIEITYYVLLVSGFWALWRLGGIWRRLRCRRPIIRLATWFAVMIALGLALAAVQLVPLYELVSQSFREGSATLEQILKWAWPSRQIVTFLLPDAFGNPTHHAYLDIWSRTWVPVTHNALGQPLRTIDWGVKNYVEGANYLGLPTLLLAVTAALATLRQGLSSWPASQAREVTMSPAHPIAGLAMLAILSLLFAFGTPLYAVLYYLLPGYNQLHSPFRWVFPYTLSMALLAGFGLELLPRNRRIGLALGWGAIAAGAAMLALVGLSVVLPQPFVALGDRLLAASDLARERGFADGAMAWSYEALGLARFGLLALLAGMVLLWPIVVSQLSRRQITAWPWAVALVLLVDLWWFGHGFNSAADPACLAFKPPVIQWLQDQQDSAQPWRLTTFDAPGEKTLNANAAMPFGLEDVRGYDSIIPRQYVAYMERIQPQGDLLYNRIAPIYTQVDGRSNYDALDSPLLDLLGVRYVITLHTIPNPGYELVYDREVKVYQNLNAYPRVFIVPQALAASDQTQALDLLTAVDPAQVVVVEGISDSLPPPASLGLREARISRYTAREVFVDVNISDRGWLVLTDSYFQGWKAYLRPFGAAGEGISATGEAIEQELPIYRANGAFRAVYLPQAGQWTVRFVYSPRSVLLGAYTTFLAGVALLLLGGWWAWGRYYRGETSEMGTVAKNSVVQMGMSLLNKGIDFAFAMLRLRVLSPAGEGSYTFAIVFYGVFEILTRFGLGTLLTRDVALDRSRASRYLSNVVVLRAILWLASLPLMVLVGLFYRVFLHQLSTAEAQAIALFGLALLFANTADALSAVFNAFEKMEYPAGVATTIGAAKVALGALVLLPPFNLGFVGLAGVSLLMNLVQVGWLYVLLRNKVLPSERALQAGPFEDNERQQETRPMAPARVDWALQRYMIWESGPLMINHLLASVFWRLDLWVLKAFVGATAVGIFSAGVKYLDGLNVIPSYFTLAIFPLMSRYAVAGREALARAYRLAAQLLFIVALPLAVSISFAATSLIRILGGAAYLPDSATALTIMIWSIPIGFINSVTQYVLIAVNQQRFLTKAFVIGVLFNSVANLVFVPRYGYLAAAAILIPAELSLFVPFYWSVRRHVTSMPWINLLGRPVLAAGFEAVTVWTLESNGLPLLGALAVGFLVYGVALLFLGTFRGEDFAILRRGLRRQKPGWEQGLWR